MAITHVGSTAGSGNTTTSMTLVIHASTAAGDIVIASFTNRDGTTDPAVVDNDTGGNLWAKLGGGATGLSVWWKRATSATAGKTITATLFTGSCSGNCSTYRGVMIGTVPYENVTTESNASGDETHAAITPTRDGSWVFLVNANRTNDLAVSTQAATSPAVITERAEHLSMGGSDCSNTLASAEQTTAGTTGTISWAQTNAASISTVFNLIPAVSLVCAVGAFTFSGVAATLTKQSKITAAVGAFVLTGNPAGLNRGYSFSAAVGVFSFAGVAAGLTKQSFLVASVGAFVLSGISAGLTAQRKLAADTGVFTFTGNAADLIFTPAAGASINAETGAFVFTGVAATLTKQSRLTADVGAFVLVGNAAGLAAQRRLAADSGAFLLTGQPATFVYGRALVAASGAFLLSGQDAGLRAGRWLTVAAGAFVFTGNNATLIANPLGGGVVRRGIFIFDD